MANELIFNKPNTSLATTKRESFLNDVVEPAFQSRRIATNTNGTFKKVVNGEIVGDAVRGKLDIIILSFLPKVSRSYYAGKYDPKAEAAAPDCWSNLGDFPDEGAANPQGKSCMDCPQNVEGSGEGGRRACRYSRRISVLLANDPSGEVYQMNIPAASLFGKGKGNEHPFEAYVKYLQAHNEMPDTVVTTIAYDDNADTMKFVFSPLRPVTDAEWDLVGAAHQKKETKEYTIMKAFKKREKAEAPEEPKKVVAKKEAPPVEKKAVKSVLEDWDD